MLFISSPLGWMFSHGHCMRRILAHAYAVLPVGLDVHMYLGVALPFGLGFEISYGLFHTPPLWVGGLGIHVDAYFLCRSGRHFNHARIQSDIFFQSCCVSVRHFLHAFQAVLYFCVF